MAWQYKKHAGFTLIETLVVVVVIGILATIGITSYSGSQLRARDTEREADARALAQALEVYVATNNSFPMTMTTTSFGPSVSQNIFKSPGDTSASSIVNISNTSAFDVPTGTSRKAYIYVPFVNGPAASDASCGTVSNGGVVAPCDSFGVLYFYEQANEWRWITSKKYPPPASRLTQLRAKLAASGA